ncbi:MAG: thiamine phosphate synthase, partial [Myxococcales bacterium]|nr:thiamine phosphate synthase [Myxococcales bacterium]
LVLDDAHRLDPASAEILARIFGDPRGYALLLLATHRGDARTLDPPLRLIADEAAARGATVTERSIEPLSIGDTLGLLRDSLLPAAISLRSLAEHIFARAGGNPLYTRVLLEELHTSGQLLFDRERGAWRWEQDQRGDEADVDVVALLTTRLADLPPATREAVAAASCVGQRFSFSHLSHLLERPPNEVREALALEVDYIGFGPIFATRSKERPDPTVGLEGLTAAAALVRGALPIIAIGGLDEARAVAAIRAGASGAALISALHRANASATRAAAAALGDLLVRTYAERAQLPPGKTDAGLDR